MAADAGKGRWARGVGDSRDSSDGEPGGLPDLGPGTSSGGRASPSPYSLVSLFPEQAARIPVASPTSALEQAAARPRAARTQASVAAHITRASSGVAAHNTSTSSNVSTQTAATARRHAGLQQAATTRKQQRRPGGDQHERNQAATFVGELRRCRGTSVGDSTRARDGWRQSMVKLGMARA